jgi:hypothetical protein
MDVVTTRKLANLFFSFGTASGPENSLASHPSSTASRRQIAGNPIPRRATSNPAVHITNPIFPCKSLDYREISKPIYVVNRPLSTAFQPRNAIPHHPR